MLDPVAAAFLLTVASRSAPLIFASLGGFASERGGVINIGLEGKMLGAAVTTALFWSLTGSAWLSMTGGIAASLALALVHWVATQKYSVDHVISGMAINILAFGAADFLNRRYLANADDGAVSTLSAPAFFTLALLLPIGIWWFVRSMRAGLWLQAVGSEPDKSRQMGIEPHRVRFWGLVTCGVLCGVAGVMIVTHEGGHYTDGMTAGRGFIALAALIIGGWRPVPAALACLFFGVFEALKLQLQGTDVFGAQIPSPVWVALPYMVTVVALAGFLGRSRTPAGLGKP